MGQVNNHSVDQVMHGLFPKRVLDTVLDAMTDHEKLSLEVLDNETKSRAFALVILKMLKSAAVLDESVRGQSGRTDFFNMIGQKLPVRIEAIAQVRLSSKAVLAQWNFTLKIAVISDIHGNLSALEAVLADIQRRGADMIVNLGDILSGALQPRETADLLMSLGLPTIRGNHERQVLGRVETMGPSDRHAYESISNEHKEWLKSLPASIEMDDVLLVHGTPSSDLEYFLETVDENGSRAASTSEITARLGSGTADLILCGHTHIPRTVRLGDRLIVNPGSVGLQAYDDERPFSHVMATGTPHAKYAIVSNENGRWTSEHLSIPYNWDTAAALAIDNGRPDWVVPLTTGRVA